MRVTSPGQLVSFRRGRLDSVDDAERPLVLASVYHSSSSSSARPLAAVSSSTPGPRVME